MLPEQSDKLRDIISSSVEEIINRTKQFVHDPTKGGSNLQYETSYNNEKYTMTKELSRNYLN